MEQTPLGKTGLNVSRFCLGTMMFGQMGNTDHRECSNIINRALDAGINFIDTADVYSAGESEEIVGKTLQAKREEVVLASKFFMPMGEDSNMRGGSRKWVVRAVEDSLRRLKTDYLDLYQIHRYDSSTDMEEILFTLTELVRQGKIRYFGSSMFPADRIVESHWVAERRGLMKFRCEQPCYSLFARDIERFVLPACRRYGMGAIIWSPLDGGFLTGKYRKTEDLSDDTRIAWLSRMLGRDFDPRAELYQRKLSLVEALSEIARDEGMSLLEMSMAFPLQHPDVTSAIIGPRTMEHLEGVLPAADIHLSTDLLDTLDTLIPPGSSVNPISDWPDGTAQRRAPG